MLTFNPYKTDMKKLLLLFTAFLALVSCRSEDDTDNAAFVGTWNWVSTYTKGVQTTPQSTSTTVELTFNADNTFSVKENGTVTKTGVYTLYRDITNSDHLEKLFINMAGYKIRIVDQVTETQLVLSDDEALGIQENYTKKIN